MPISFDSKTRSKKVVYKRLMAGGGVSGLHFSTKYKKRKQSLKRKKGGCNCNIKFNGLKGGGDFFNGGNIEPASFINVPTHSFYPMNSYTAGTDLQGLQINSRLDPIKGGKRKSIKRKKGGKSGKSIKSGKRKKGGNVANMSSNFISSFSDPLLNGNKVLMNSLGNTSGSFMAPEIIKGKIF